MKFRDFRMNSRHGRLLLLLLGFEVEGRGGGDWAVLGKGELVVKVLTTLTPGELSACEDPEIAHKIPPPRNHNTPTVRVFSSALPASGIYFKT